MHNYRNIARSDLIKDDTAVMKMNYLLMSTLFSSKSSSILQDWEGVYDTFSLQKVKSEASVTLSILPFVDRFATETVNCKYM